MTHTDKILEVTRGEFQLESIAGMRSDVTVDAYIDFLDTTIKAVVGYSKYKENRIQGLSVNGVPILMKHF